MEIRNQEKRMAINKAASDELRASTLKPKYLNAFEPFFQGSPKF